MTLESAQARNPVGSGLLCYQAEMQRELVLGNVNHMTSACMIQIVWACFAEQSYDTQIMPTSSRFGQARHLSIRDMPTLYYRFQGPRSWTEVLIMLGPFQHSSEQNNCAV